MNIEEIKKSYLIEKEEISDLKSFNELKIKYLSKKGIVNSLMNELKDLDKEEKIKVATGINELKKFIEKDIETVYEKIYTKELEAKLEKEKIDLTLPGNNLKSGNKHPLTMLIDDLSDLFVGLGYSIEEGPEVELDHYNFEMLNLPVGHPAREMHDTFYIDENSLLRTHTSPVQARTMEKSGGKPIKIVCPGKVYRKDDDDAGHSHQFIQMEGLVIDKNITMSDLKGTLETVMKEVFGQNREIRFRNSYFPFTEPSVEVDVSCFVCEGKGCSLCKKTGWIEILGAGMVHPNVLKMGGYDSDVYQGFAFGFGIDRIAMLKYGIDDIKNFYSNDLRFLKQIGGK